MTYHIKPEFANQAATLPECNFNIIDPAKPVIQHFRAVSITMVSLTHTRVINAWKDRVTQPDYANESC